MSARQKGLLKRVYYPESDGQPIGETDKHILLMFAFCFLFNPCTQEFLRTPAEEATARQKAEARAEEEAARAARLAAKLRALGLDSDQR